MLLWVEWCEIAVVMTSTLGAHWLSNPIGLHDDSAVLPYVQSTRENGWFTVSALFADGGTGGL
eukprot:3390630-Pleurochrysis_carterae.AAC.2